MALVPSWERASSAFGSLGSTRDSSFFHLPLPTLASRLTSDDMNTPGLVILGRQYVTTVMR